jgi:hypothetical protein
MDCGEGVVSCPICVQSTIEQKNTYLRNCGHRECNECGCKEFLNSFLACRLEQVKSLGALGLSCGFVSPALCDIVRFVEALSPHEQMVCRVLSN